MGISGGILSLGICIFNLVKAYDVIIIGGGLAGLTAALHLSQNQLEVLLIEKQVYPHHKVCGEYLSNEVKPYLEALGVRLPKAVAIEKLCLSTNKGTTVVTQLPLGGMGISRYALDEALYLKALEKGVAFAFESVNTVDFVTNNFEVHTSSGVRYLAEIVVGAYGKRSALDKQLDRKFIKSKSPWLAVKSHYEFKEFPDELVALHNFRGGYAGLSKTETGAVNFCYLVNYKSFGEYQDVEHFNNNVVRENPFLKEFLDTATPLFEKPITIGQLSFKKKQLVEQHMLMCGDTAGLIHPLCGNGMAMAIHSAKIASELILAFFGTKEYQRKDLEAAYTRSWRAAFSKRLAAGRRLQSILLNHRMADHLIHLAIKSPGLLKRIVKSTHGQPLT